MSKGQKVPVTMRAVLQRINRTLARRGDHRIKATRGGARLREELGDYYVIAVERHFIVETDVNPEAYGRDLGVLRPWERLIEEERA